MQAESTSKTAVPRHQRWMPDQILQALKEIVTAVMGLLVVGYTVYLTGRTLDLVDKPASMTAAKDVLLLMMGLAGVVIGYYFGRIPADSRASQAIAQATEATVHSEKVGTQAQLLADQMDDLLVKIPKPTDVSRGDNNNESQELVDDLEQMRDELRVLSRMSGS